MGHSACKPRMAALTLLVLAGWTACRPGPARTPRAAAGFIAVVGASEQDPLWPILKTSTAWFRQFAGEMEVRVEAPPLASPNLQAELIDRLRKDGARGLCVQVIDPRASVGLLESLRSSGVVVVTMLRRVESGEPFLHCGVDPREVGVALAHALAERVASGGTVGVLYADDDDVCRLRRAGFKREFARHPRLTVLRELDCRGDAATAVRLMRETTERFPGIDGWVAMGSWPLHVADEGRPLLPPGCALVLPGPLADPVGAIRSGKCQALVVAEDYRQIVTQALEMCLLSVDQQIVHRRVLEVPARRVTRQTLPEFARDWALWSGAADERGAAPEGSP